MMMMTMMMMLVSAADQWLLTQSIQWFVTLTFSQRPAATAVTQAPLSSGHKEKINRIGLWILLTRAALIRFAWRLRDGFNALWRQPAWR